MANTDPIATRSVPVQVSLKATIIFSALISLVFIVFSLMDGLYFDKSFMTTALYWLPISMIFLIWLQASRIKLSGWNYADVAVAVFFLITILSAIQPANVEFAVLGTVRNVSYFFMYGIVRLLVSVDGSPRRIQYGVVLSGFLFGLYGLANGFGTLNVNGAIFDTSLRRLASNFEYSNTYASYEAVVYILAMSLMSGQLKKDIWLAAAGTVAVTSIVLTYSRGTWLVLAGGLLLFLILMPRKEKGLATTNIVITTLASVVSIPLLSKAVLSMNSFLGWSVTIGSIGITLGLLFASSLILIRMTSKQKTVSAVIGAIIAVIALVSYFMLKGLPQNIVQRVESINMDQFSVIQRFLFYKDGIKVLKDDPILGVGPNGWLSIFQKYQTYPYVSRQSHSMAIDLLMSYGVLGVLAFVGVLALIVWTSIRTAKTWSSEHKRTLAGVLAGLATLLAHAVIDFDYSYGTINFLMWSLIAMSLPLLIVKYPSPLARLDTITIGRQVGLYSGILGTIMLVLVAGGYLLSNQYMTTADKQVKQPALALATAQNATFVAPYRPSAWLTRAKYEEVQYNSTKKKELAADIIQHAQEAASLAPHDPVILRNAAGFLGKYGAGTQAIELARQAWVNAPYKIENAEQYAIFTDTAGTQYYGKDNKRAKELFQTTLSTYKDVQQRIANFKYLNPVLHLEYKYEETPVLRLNTAESAFYLGQYDLVRHLLQPLQNSKVADDANKAKVIMAAANEKQKKPIDATTLQIIQKDHRMNQYFSYLTKINLQ